MNARIAAKIAGSTRQKRKRGRPRREEVWAMGRMPTELEKRDNDNRQEERLAVTCEWCDKEFAGQKGQRFCSRSHASLFTAQRKTLTECLWCHEGFKARKGQEFCCQAHGVIYRQHHKQQPECQWCHQKFTSARGARFCSKSHAGLFNAKKRDDQVELDRMDRIAEDVWQRILRQEAAFLAAVNGRLRRVLPGELHLANLSACNRAAKTGKTEPWTVTAFVPKVSQ